MKLRLANTGVVVTAAGSTGNLIVTGTVRGIVFEFGFTSTGVIFIVTGRSGGIVVAGTVGRRIDVFGGAVTRLLTGQEVGRMNDAGRELWRRAGLIQIVIFHTVRIVFDNVAAAHIFRTT